MKKLIPWFLVATLFLMLAYLASRSEVPLDDSVRFVDIDRYLTRQAMAQDIDTLVHTFERIHPYPYRFVEKRRLRSRVDSTKAHLPDSMTTMHFWRLIDQLLIGYNDAHSKVEDRYVLAAYVKKNRYFFPFSATVSRDKIRISTHDTLEYPLVNGTEIVKINGKTSEQLLRDLVTHATRETPALKRLEISDDFGFYLWKTYDWGPDFTIHYRTKEDSDLDSIVVNGIPWAHRKRSENPDTVAHTFTFLTNRIGLMKISDFNGDEGEVLEFYRQSFQSMADRNCTHLLLDFRGHSGGADSYGEHLAKYISMVPYRKLSKAYWKITPEFKEAFDRTFVPIGLRWFTPIYLVNEYSRVFYGADPNELVTVNYELKTPLPEEERFAGQVYLITDHRTFSAGSIFAEMFKYYNMGTIVGQPTGNLTSFTGFALANFILPNSTLSFQVSSVYNVANSREEGLKTVEPDIHVDAADDPLTQVIGN
ncbi:S41 family peptidase [Cyclobacterium xiamenense]|uniref:S41 family peptidase n=1 Tax=Cyclobacterium xiamenense TaxID=1297121 RepID=UPI00138719EC|nr:S41 family peptidase [Cyclobacterium xiamenense]